MMSNLSLANVESAVWSQSWLNPRPCKTQCRLNANQRVAVSQASRARSIGMDYAFASIRMLDHPRFAIHARKIGFCVITFIRGAMVQSCNIVKAD